MKAHRFDAQSMRARVACLDAVQSARSVVSPHTVTPRRVCRQANSRASLCGFATCGEVAPGQDNHCYTCRVCHRSDPLLCEQRWLRLAALQPCLQRCRPRLQQARPLARCLRRTRPNRLQLTRSPAASVTAKCDDLALAICALTGLTAALQPLQHTYAAAATSPRRRRHRAGARLQAKHRPPRQLLGRRDRRDRRAHRAARARKRTKTTSKPTRCEMN